MSPESGFTPPEVTEAFTHASEKGTEMSDESQESQPQKVERCLDGRAFLVEKDVDDLADRLVSEHGETMQLSQAVEVCEPLYKTLKNLPGAVVRQVLEAYLVSSEVEAEEVVEEVDDGTNAMIEDAKKKVSDSLNQNQ